MNGIIHVDQMPAHPGAIYVGRENGGRGKRPPLRRSRFANPFNHKTYGRARAVEMFSRWLEGDATLSALVTFKDWQPPTRKEIRDALAGKVLVCWCPEGEPCHAAVLAEIAAAPQ